VLSIPGLLIATRLMGATALLEEEAEVEEVVACSALEKRL
jgi:hypothetical protein